MWFLFCFNSKKILILLIIINTYISAESISNGENETIQKSFKIRLLKSKEIKFNYQLLKEELYSVLKINQSENFDENLNYNIHLKKNSLNYSINDGIWIELQKDSNNFINNQSEIFNAKHIRFSYKIDKENPSQYSEQCNLRLTNATFDNLKKNDYRTLNSDPLFFRIRTNNSIILNDKYFYFTNFTENNYDSNFKTIDLFLDWNKNKIFTLFKRKILDNTLTYSEMLTDFYHKNLNENVTNANKMVLYNFHPNTSCVIRNLEVCEDFCDENSRSLFLNITRTLSASYIEVKYKALSMLLLILIAIL